MIEIAAQTRRLATQVRDGSVAPADLSGEGIADIQHEQLAFPARAQLREVIGLKFLHLLAHRVDGANLVRANEIELARLDGWYRVVGCSTGSCPITARWWTAPTSSSTG